MRFHLCLFLDISSQELSRTSSWGIFRCRRVKMVSGYVHFTGHAFHFTQCRKKKKITAHNTHNDLPFSINDPIWNHRADGTVLVTFPMTTILTVPGVSKENFNIMILIILIPKTIKRIQTCRTSIFKFYIQKKSIILTSAEVLRETAIMWLQVKKVKREKMAGRERESPTSALKRIPIALIYSKSSYEGVEKRRLASYPISHNIMDTWDLKLYIFPFSLIIIIDTQIFITITFHLNLAGGSWNESL